MESNVANPCYENLIGEQLSLLIRKSETIHIEHGSTEYC